MKECNNDGTKKERNEQYRRRKESEQSAARMKKEREKRRKEEPEKAQIWKARMLYGNLKEAATDWPLSLPICIAPLIGRYQAMAAALVPDRNGGSKQMNPFCACPAAWTNHSLHREINTPTLVLLRLGHVGPP